MRYTSIKGHLKAYSIYARRATTINHAFAAAVAPHDAFDDKRVREALETLGQDPEKAIACVLLRRTSGNVGPRSSDGCEQGIQRARASARESAAMLQAV
jgi:hypothetical protein